MDADEWAHMLEVREVAWRVAYRISGSRSVASHASDYAGLGDRSRGATRSAVAAAAARLCHYPAAWMDHRDHGLPEPFTEDLTVRDGVVADPFRLHRRSDVDGGVRTAAMVAQLDLPLEQRIAYVLRDVVELPFPDIADVLQCSAADAQRYEAEARRRMAQVEPSADLSEQYRVMQSFLSTVRTGDVAAVAAVLDPEVVVLAEGWRATEERQGSTVLRPVVARIVGAEQVARFSLDHLAPAYHPDLLAEAPSVTCSDDATVIHTGPTRINGDVGMLAPGESRNQYGECVSVGRATVFSSRSGRTVRIYDWAAAASLGHLVP